MEFRIVLLLTFTLFVKVQTDEYVRGCYYTNWSQYRPGSAAFFPEDIDPFLCTHVFYAFAIIDEDNHIITSDPNDEDLYARINDLKSQNPDLKTLLGVGGWGFGMSQVSIMLESPESRAEFIDSTVPFLRTHGFDGLDLDFEFPGHDEQGSKPIDKYKYTALVMELKAAFEEEAADTGNTQLLLTAAVSARKHEIDDGYQVEIIAQYLDYILIMTYDFHGSWSNFTGLNAPLYPRDEEEGAERLVNVNFAVNYWLAKGAIRERLVLGLAFYGRGFTLASNDTGLGAPVSGPGPSGPLGGEGFYIHIEICSVVDGTKVFDEEQLAPYAWRDDIWVGYDDYRSLACKINYMMDNELAGFFMWSIEMDDFNGEFCGDGVYPLLNYIVDVMEGDPGEECYAGTTLTSISDGN